MGASMRILFGVAFTACAVLSEGAHAAAFWDGFPVLEADACRTRIEAEAGEAKRLTGEIGPDDLIPLSGQKVLVTEAELADGDYSAADFTGYLFQDAVFSSRLQGAKFKNAVLDSSVFVNSDLTEADFSGATLCSADFTETKLERAKFTNAVLIGPDFSLASGTAANFTGAKIYGGIFNGALFDKGSFRGAALYCRPEEIDLPCAAAEKSSFKGADFSNGAVLLDLDGDFTDATFEGAAVVAEMVPRLVQSYFVQLRAAPHPLSSNAAPLSLTRQDVTHLIGGWEEQVVAGSGSPSFDCGKATSKVESTICKSPELSSRDFFLDKLFKDTVEAAGEGAEDIRTAQRDWVVQRDACAAQDNPACLPELYDQRAMTLAADRAKARSVQEEAKAGRYDPVADLATVPKNVLGSPLGDRLAALRARSTGEATIEAAGEGALSFTAEAVGVGGHACSLTGEFIYAPPRGIYVHRADDQEVAQIVVAEDYILFLGAQDYCGLRAQWPRVLHLSAAN